MKRWRGEGDSRGAREARAEAFRQFRTASPFPIRIEVKKGEGMYIQELACQHCNQQVGPVVVNRLPFDCPECNAPLLGLCKMGLNSDRKIVWQQFPPFPGTVDLKGE